MRPLSWSEVSAEPTAGRSSLDQVSSQWFHTQRRSRHQVSGTGCGLHDTRRHGPPPSAGYEDRSREISTVRVQDSIEIGRPVGDVFEFVTNVDNFPQWAGPAVEVSGLTGPPQEGDTFTLVQKFLGRKFDSPCEVTSVESNRRFAYRSTGASPVPFTFTYAFEPSGAGTSVTMTAEGEPGSFFRLAGPLFEKAGKRQVKNDLETLKDMLEEGQ
ncbi:MAG TPA: SRPBCC family protein [Propionibacteriaceae bacterium]|nr:SRPBCC family protein [Propionibacteriaceae bacterium]